MNQRWRDKLGSFRPADEIIQTHRYEVAPLKDDTTPKAFVEQHHYSRSFPAARFRFGLYTGSSLVGVAVFSIPANDKVITNRMPCAALEGTELGRFVLLDNVPGNGETWFLARCFELLRRESLFGVVSFSDPIPRTRLDGVQVFPGHIGTIYQAFNAVYDGLATARTLYLLPDGTSFNARTMQKIRGRERTWQSAVEQLVSFGAAPLRADEDSTAWLNFWMSKLTRKMSHPGNHTYLWTLSKRDRKHIRKDKPVLAYPKRAA